MLERTLCGDFAYARRKLQKSSESAEKLSMKIGLFLLAMNMWASRDLDSVLLKLHGAQALPQICPIMVVGKVTSVTEENSTNGEPPVLKIRVVESIWGHFMKDHRVTAQWLPLEMISEIDPQYEAWSKIPLKLPSDITGKEVILGLFPAENKKNFEFVIKPICRYQSAAETKQRLTCLREKRCHDFIPGRLVIR